MRVLVLTSEPVNAELLRGALGDDAGDAEVLVVSPALQDSGLRFWMSDADEAIARAEQVQEETVERLDEEGIDAAGDTGEADPLLALQDALQTYPADEIVLCVHSESGRNWQGEGGGDEARERLGQPGEE